MPDQISRTTRKSEDNNHQPVVIKIKPGFNSDERKKKFMSHSKFSSQVKHKKDGGFDVSQHFGIPETYGDGGAQ